MGFGTQGQGYERVEQTVEFVGRVSRGPRGSVESHLFDLVNITQKFLDHLSHIDYIHHV